MTLKAKVKFMQHHNKSAGGLYPRGFIYIPRRVIEDSNFPWESGQIFELSVNLNAKNITLTPTGEIQKKGKLRFRERARRKRK